MLAANNVSGPQASEPAEAETEETTDDNSSSDTQEKEKLQGESSKAKIIYHVKEGDNLKSIASMYDVRISDIRNWNDIPFGQEADELDSIDIWVPKSKLAMYENINGLNSSEKTKLVSTKSAIKPDKDKGWVTHKVKKNETLGKIAEKYDVSVTSLKKWNNLKKNSIAKGKALKIYTQSSEPELYASAKKTAKTGTTHKVEKNETLYSIAKANNVTVKELLEWNNLSENDKLKAGQNIKLGPSQQSSETKLAKKETKTTKAEKDDENFSTYKVKKGDNLSSIAEAYGVKVEDIREWNNISGNNIKFGQTLKLHETQQSTSKGDNAKTKTSLRKEYYKVKKGDTFYGISKKFSISQKDLKEWNKISVLKTGDKIIIYR